MVTGLDSSTLSSVVVFIIIIIIIILGNVMYVSLRKFSHKFSKLPRRSISALPGRRLKDAFSLQMSPRTTGVSGPDSSNPL